MTKEQKEPWRKLADDAIKEKEFAAKKRTATVRSKSANGEADRCRWHQEADKDCQEGQGLFSVPEYT